jgi:hypothetical protein
VAHLKDWLYRDSTKQKISSRLAQRRFKTIAKIRMVIRLAIHIKFKSMKSLYAKLFLGQNFFAAV